MKIMICYDGSQSAKKALILAEKRAKLLNAELFVIRSMESVAIAELDDFEKAEQDLREIEYSLKEAGIPCETRLITRGLSPEEDLLEFAEEYGIDEMCIGIEKRSKVNKLFFGSTAQYLILNAPCPVLTVK
jgi:nucleotide-binding universal stress UspA family protein